ncbi:MAG TPA: DUF2520 domain-containing protein [Candidatus Kapabacteria bacterium]|nr:DUF2520 domain-containing protein [Candidatus Kapabacteria bacterium]
MARQVTIAVIGKGRLGSSIAGAIRNERRKYKLFAHPAARSKSFNMLRRNGGPDVLFIVCKDKYISDVARTALLTCGANTKIIAHCAGALSSEILPKRKGISRLMLHPIQTFTKSDPNAFSGITFGAESKDNKALQFAYKFIGAIGANEIILLKPKQLPLYHAMIVLGANFITLLGAAVEELSDALKIPSKKIKKALAPLMKRSLDNVLANDAADVLTGPLARRDFETIRKHKKALSNTSSQELYNAFVKFAEKL